MRSARHQTVHEVRTGETVDGFVVGKLMHEGGMARLYRVTRRGISAPMVMKVPRIGAGAPAAALPALENELRVLQRLHGPHVPKLFGHGDLRTTPYLVMEYIEEDHLAQAVKRAPLAIDLGPAYEYRPDDRLTVSRVTHSTHAWLNGTDRVAVPISGRFNGNSSSFVISPPMPARHYGKPFVR